LTRRNFRSAGLKENPSIWDIYLKWHEQNTEARDKDDFHGVERVNDGKEEPPA